MVDTPIQVFDLPEQEQGIPGTFTVFSQEEASSVAPIVADARAEKYNFAMGDQSPGRDNIAMAIRQGSDQYLRIQMIRDQNIREARMKQTIAEDIARGKGGELSKQEREIIQSLTSQEVNEVPRNPDTILEKLYGQKVLDMSNAIPAASAYTRLIAENPDLAEKYHERGSDLIAKREVAQKLLEEVDGRWQKASGAGMISNYIESAIPGVSWYRMQNALEGLPKASFLPGNNRVEQVQHFWSLPLDEAQAKLKQAITEMESSNPIDAINFLNAVLSMTRSDQFVDNAIGILDLSTPIPLGAPIKAAKGAAKGVVTASEAVRKAIAETARVATKPGVKAVEILEPTGDAALVAKEYHAKVLSEAASRAANQGQQATWEETLGRLPLLMNPKAWFEGGELAKSAPFLDKVTKELTTTSARMIDGVIVEPVNIHRIEPGTPAFDAAVDEALYRVKVQATGFQDNIMYASPGKPLVRGALQDETLSGVNTIDFFVGQNGGVPFVKESDAKFWARRWEINPDIVPEGNGFAIRMRTTINEGDATVRGKLLESQAPTPKSLWNLALSWARTPNDLLSTDVVRDRTVATYGLTKMVDMARSMITEVRSSMSSQSLKDFDKFITWQRDFVKPGEEIPGRFSNNLAEFEMDWKSIHGRLPTDVEATAYARYLQVNEMDFAFRSLMNHKAKASVGIEMHSLPWGGPIFNTTTVGGPKVEGRLVRDNPFDSPQSFSFLVWKADGSDFEYIADSQARSVSRPAWEKRFKDEGLVPINLTKEGEKMLRARHDMKNILPRGSIDYIYVKGSKASPLPINQLPFRPGGHRRLEDGFFLAQPDLKERTIKGNVHHFYRGDINMAHFVRESDAKEMLDLFEQARKLYNEGRTGGDMTALTKFLANEMGGLYDLQGFSRLFSKSGPFNADRPFSIRPTGRSINDVENLSTKYSNFRIGGDDLHSVENLRMDPAYTQERGAVFHTYAWSGSDATPVLKMEPAKLVDPMQTMESAFHNILRGRYIDDLRIKVTERFINEFAGILDTPIERLRANPWAHMLEPTYKKGADPQVVNAAKSLRRTMLEFMNIQTPLEKEIGYVRQKLADSIYRTVGKDGMAKLEKGVELLDWMTLGATKDPVRFMRSLAFHEKLGLLNPKQLFLQAQNITTVVALEGPARGWKAANAYMLHRAMMENSSKEITDAIAKGAVKMGWTREELLESWDAAYRTGFFRVGGEVSHIDQAATPSLVQTSFGRTLDNAAFFFREGERISRITSWNAAYLRWKELNPGKLLTDVEAGKILERADILNGNMSRASNALWQQGVFSIPTQFWSYQARLADLMFGKRLTTTEKARMVTTYSLMYGLPTGFAVAGAGLVWPWQEAATKYMAENGIAYDERAVTRLMNEGFLGVANGVIFGEPTSFSQDFSPQGLSVVKDFLDPDKGLINFLRGASGTVLVENMKTIHPFVMALGKTVGFDTGYDLTARDFTDAFSQISSVSNLTKALHAYSAQEYWSKKEQKLVAKDVTLAQTVITAATGLMPREINVAYAMAASEKDRKASQDEIRTLAIKNLRLGFKASNVSEADGYFRRAQVHIQSGAFTPREQYQILQHAARGHESMVDSMALKYAQTKPERLQDYLRKGN